MITSMTNSLIVTKVLSKVAGDPDAKLIIFYSADVAKRMKTFPERVLPLVSGSMDKENLTNLLMRVELVELPKNPSPETLDFILNRIVDPKSYYFLTLNDSYKSLFAAIIQYEEAMTDIMSKSIGENNFPWQEDATNLKILTFNTDVNPYINVVANVIAEDYFDLFTYTEAIPQNDFELNSKQYFDEIRSSEELSIFLILKDGPINLKIVEELNKYYTFIFKKLGYTFVDPTQN